MTVETSELARVSNRLSDLDTVIRRFTERCCQEREPRCRAPSPVLADRSGSAIRLVLLTAEPPLNVAGRVLHLALRLIQLPLRL